MSYHVQYEKSVQKQLRKMDAYTRTLILRWIDKNLENCDNPRIFGKGLVENHSGEWRYRIGDYRVLAEIKDEIVAIQIIKIGHRKDVY
jgi:mRNA interferase RelE/StbE